RAFHDEQAFARSDRLPRHSPSSRKERRRRRHSRARTRSCEAFPDGRADEFDIGVRKLKTGRQIKAAAADALGYWIALAREEPALVEDRLLVHAGEERPRLNALIPQLGGEAVGIHRNAVIQQDGVHPVDILEAGFLDGEDETRHIAQAISIAGSD